MHIIYLDVGIYALILISLRMHTEIFVTLSNLLVYLSFSFTSSKHDTHTQTYAPDCISGVHSHLKKIVSRKIK